MSETNLKNVFNVLCSDKAMMSGEDIKKCVLHDSVVHEQTLNEYFDQIDMKYEKNVTFYDFFNMIKNTCKLKEKDEGKTRAKKQETRYAFKGLLLWKMKKKLKMKIEKIALGKDINIQMRMKKKIGHKIK